MPGHITVRGARQHNLANVDVSIPRDALVVFTGVSGSGKSSLAFGTLYAEAQRRYLESVAPYARRLFEQVGAPEVDAIDGLPPAVALQQARGVPSSRSSVGTLSTLSNLLRMLFSRAGTYPQGAAPLAAEAFSAQHISGACPRCAGLGHSLAADAALMVPDPARSLRERAIAAWPPAWHGQNLRDIVTTLGIDIDVPWRALPAKTRRWLLFTEAQPSVPVYPGYSLLEVRRAVRRREPPSYQGTFSSAQRYLLHTYRNSPSTSLRARVRRFLVPDPCPACGGRRLRPEALAVRFAGLDIAATSELTLAALAAHLAPYHDGSAPELAVLRRRHPERALVIARIVADVQRRVAVLRELGLGYLGLARRAPSLSPGELQRLRLGTQVCSQLFGVVYVLDEPSAGLHPEDTRALLAALCGLRDAGNSLFVVEHELDVMRAAQWLVDVGPGAGSAGGQVLYSGPPAGLRAVAASQTAAQLFAPPPPPRTPRQPRAWLQLADVHCHNVRGLSVALPLGVLTAVTGISGSGKSSLVARALPALLATALDLPHAAATRPDAGAENDADTDALDALGDGPLAAPPTGRIVAGAAHLRRLVQVDQRPIGRTPRSNLATYTGLFDAVRRLFAATPAARARRYSAGRFSFNVAAGRCPACEGAGVIAVEMLFMAGVWAPCTACHGTRYNDATLAVRLRGQRICDVLAMRVADAAAFFAATPTLARSLGALQEVGLGYLRLGQPATELSGGEAQRIKLATEMQRPARQPTLYVLDEPTTGLHPADVQRLQAILAGLTAAGHTVVVVEHDMQVIAGSDWVIDMGPGGGSAGGRVVAAGPPLALARAAGSRTAPHLARFLGMAGDAAPSRPR